MSGTAGPPTHPAVDVVLGGTVFCDLVFSGLALPERGTEVFAQDFVVSAGGTANRAVATARLGMHTGLLAVLGADLFGDHLHRQLAAEPGLDLRWVRRDARTRTAVTVAVTDRHDRSFITYEEAGTDVPDTWSGPLPAARACHVGVARSIPSWVVDLRAAGTTVFGGVGWDPTGAWSPAVLDGLAGVDVLVLNDVEAMGYTRAPDVATAAEVLAERVPTVVVTRGPAGALAIGAATGARVDQPAPEVTVLDPTGAGDVFTGALITATVLGWDLETAIRFAVLAGSLSVQSLGGALSAPRPCDIVAALRHAAPPGDWTTVLDWAESSGSSPPSTDRPSSTHRRSGTGADDAPVRPTDTEETP